VSAVATPTTPPLEPGPADGPGSAGSVTTVGPRHLSPRLRVLWHAQAAFATALVASATAITAAIAHGAEAPTTALVLGITATVVLLAGIAISATLPARAWQRWTYDLGEETLELRHGLITHRRSLVPYFRVQHIDLVAGPLERSLGISRLVVRTASATSDSQIPGIASDEADRLRRQILARAGQGDAV
jgi:uncharacterized protein